MPRRKRAKDEPPAEPVMPLTHPEPEPGIECPHCGCCDFRVVYTRPRPNGMIMRRRECRNCGWRISTMEHPLGMNAEMMKHLDEKRKGRPE